MRRLLHPWNIGRTECVPRPVCQEKFLKNLYRLFSSEQRSALPKK
jgi:hypothetical protein